MRRIAVLAAVMLLALPAVAEARVRYKVVKSTGTIQGHVVAPTTAEGYDFAGTVHDSKFGVGATTSHGGFSGLTTSGTLTVFLDRGTLDATFSFAITPSADGTFVLQGTTKYTGGTGRYKGAKGSSQTTATQDADGYTTFHYTQKVKLVRR
jgi:hypothetical protein